MSNAHTNTGPKVALIHLGTDEAYGLIYVAGELLRNGVQFAWFDGHSKDAVMAIQMWKPDRLFFSPLGPFFEMAIKISLAVKQFVPNVKSIFGGAYVTSGWKSIERKGIDCIVIGPVYGTLDRILGDCIKPVLWGHPISPDQMVPSRHKYYSAIPRVAQFPRKLLMTHFGCRFNCSYCSTGSVRKRVGSSVYEKYWLTRRPIENVIDEARAFMTVPTSEVELVDDDMLLGAGEKGAEEYLHELSAAWKKYIALPLYGYVTPLSVIRASDRLIAMLSKLVTSVTLGVQAARPSSLHLLNRRFQTEDLLERAINRLRKFGIATRLDLIIGLPVDDPVNDALESLNQVQRLAPGALVICYPLLLYPGTNLHSWCISKGIPLRSTTELDCHSGLGSITFDETTTHKLIIIKRLSTMFVRYNIHHRWLKGLVDMNVDVNASRALAEAQFFETIKFRLGDKGVSDFDSLVSTMIFQY